MTAFVGAGKQEGLETKGKPVGISHMAKAISSLRGGKLSGWRTLKAHFSLVQGTDFENGKEAAGLCHCL